MNTISSDIDVNGICSLGFLDYDEDIDTQLLYAEETRDAVALESIHFDFDRLIAVEAFDVCAPLWKPHVSATPEGAAALLDKFLAHLKHHKRINLSKVSGVYVAEMVQKDPARYGLPPNLEVVSTIKPGSGRSITPLGLEMPVQGAPPRVIYKKPVVVFRMVDVWVFLRGNKAKRNMMEVTIYHEVDGHGTDFAKGSAYRRLMDKLVRISDIRTPAELQNVSRILSPLREMSANLLHLNYMIKRFGTQWHAAMDPGYGKGFDRNLRTFAHSTLNGIEAAKKHVSGQVRRVAEAIERFYHYRINSISKETRLYYFKLLKQ